MILDAHDDTTSHCHIIYTFHELWLNIFAQSMQEIHCRLRERPDENDNATFDVLARRTPTAASVASNTDIKQSKSLVLT